ncbi:Signal recognition particle subunit SRP72 [Caligus rogercresseyi]|uniref:Signal recognition particle subunit SRP72 n=1 Tax=Caligus rogercresseyi TaxID=217165 RepID=A0A7T8JXU7_CALRO|nr:Signal recognition particle subunit SRP72 [Caligus rogercresseyi]
MSKKESGDLVEKKKKKKLPMNYDPNVEPDPERWIPKRERIAFRKHLKRERRNKGEKFTGAQDDNYDYSSRKATPKSHIKNSSTHRLKASTTDEEATTKGK